MWFTHIILVNPYNNLVCLCISIFILQMGKLSLKDEVSQGLYN